MWRSTGGALRRYLGTLGYWTITTCDKNTHVLYWTWGNTCWERPQQVGIYPSIDAAKSYTDHWVV